MFLKKLVYYNQPMKTNCQYNYVYDSNSQGRGCHVIFFKNVEKYFNNIVFNLNLNCDLNVFSCQLKTVH